tara:strand:- start:8003 stop:8374 length:372 start_codon:yes stop_codon:yes gene_type:complete
MAIIKLQLKKEHINLLKHLSWNELSKDKQISTSNLETDSPFGGFDYYEDMGIILYGKPDEFIPSDLKAIENVDPFTWSEEQREEMDQLLSELPLALEVVLSTKSFEPGNYKARFHIREWKKID